MRVRNLFILFSFIFIGFVSCQTDKSPGNSSQSGNKMCNQLVGQQGVCTLSPGGPQGDGIGFTGAKPFLALHAALANKPNDPQYNVVTTHVIAKDTSDGKIYVVKPDGSKEEIDPQRIKNENKDFEAYTLNDDTPLVFKKNAFGANSNVSVEDAFNIQVQDPGTPIAISHFAENGTTGNPAYVLRGRSQNTFQYTQVVYANANSSGVSYSLTVTSQPLFTTFSKTVDGTTKSYRIPANQGSIEVGKNVLSYFNSQSGTSVVEEEGITGQNPEIQFYAYNPEITP